MIMNGAVTKNKQGQALGQKGRATRRRLMDVTRRLLKTQSPMEITAVSIAQEAETSSATFYMYFDDVKDIMFALSQAAAEEMAIVHSVVDEPWDPSVVEVAHARRVVEAFDSVWDKHREVLRYRNLEADRGDPRFEQLRIAYYMPLIERLADRILAAYPPGKRPRKGDAYAEASVIHAALEGIAATDPKVVERGLGVKRMQDARARIIAHVLGRRAEDETWSPSEVAAQKAVTEKAVAKRRKGAG
jgi:AcrR family transcriptional regulator